MNVWRKESMNPSVSQHPHPRNQCTCRSYLLGLQVFGTSLQRAAALQETVHRKSCSTLDLVLWLMHARCGQQALQLRAAACWHTSLVYIQWRWRYKGWINLVLLFLHKLWTNLQNFTDMQIQLDPRICGWDPFLSPHRCQNMQLIEFLCAPLEDLQKDPVESTTHNLHVIFRKSYEGLYCVFGICIQSNQQVQNLWIKKPHLYVKWVNMGSYYFYFSGIAGDWVSCRPHQVTHAGVTPLLTKLFKTLVHFL